MSWFSFEICRILICEICNDIDLGIMLGEKVFTSKHGETIITILNVVQ